ELLGDQVVVGLEAVPNIVWSPDGQFLLDGRFEDFDGENLFFSPRKVRWDGSSAPFDWSGIKAFAAAAGPPSPRIDRHLWLEDGRVFAALQDLGGFDIQMWFASVLYDPETHELQDVSWLRLPGTSPTDFANINTWSPDGSKLLLGRDVWSQDGSS